MTNPQYVKTAERLREELDVDGIVVIIVFEPHALPNVSSAGKTESHASRANDLAMHLTSSVIPQFLLKRGWGDPDRLRKKHS